MAGRETFDAVLDAADALCFNASDISPSTSHGSPELDRDARQLGRFGDLDLAGVPWWLKGGIVSSRPTLASLR